MTPWRPFIVALALPVLFTALVLGDVVRNRGSAGETIELTEREVALSTGSDDNSGVTAWVVWASDSEVGERWVRPETLRALGFDLAPGASGSTSTRQNVRQLQRRAYVVLELREEQPTRSRLVPVDASPDRNELLAKYPNGRMHLITGGFIGLRPVPGPRGASSLEGYLVSIDPRGIHVPAQFAPVLRQGSVRDRRFTLSVRYGSRLEPWIVDVQ